MFAFDRENGAIVDANDASTHAYRYSRDELLGLHAHALCSTKTMTTILAAAEKAGPRETIWLGPLEWMRKDGTTFEAETAVLHSSDGSGQLFVLIADSTPGSRRSP